MKDSSLPTSCSKSESRIFDSVPETLPCVPRDHRIHSGTCPQGGPRAAGLAELGLQERERERDIGSVMIQGVKEDRKKRRKEEKKEVRYTYIQWNPSNIDSTSVHISEVFRGSIGNGVVLKRCPHFHLKKKEERERGGEKLER